MGQPEQISVYYESSDKYYEYYDYITNIHIFAKIYYGQTAYRTGRNTIKQQTLLLKILIQTTSASNKTKTDFGAMGISLNVVTLI